MRALLIAEKPSLRRTIENVYKKHQSEIPFDISFIEQSGHLITLKSPDELDEELKAWSWETLPIHPEEHGGWQYKVINEPKVKNFLTPKERYQNISKELKSGNYDFVVHAGDPDQEGELLVCIVLASLRNKLPVKRFWSNATTESEILNALKNLRDDSEPFFRNLLAAAYARQHSDWRFGMNISRAASMQMKGNVSTGRVETAIQAMVCKREIEIQNFKPKTCYGVRVTYDEGFIGNLFDMAAESEIEENSKKKKSDEEDEEQSAGIIWFDTKEEAEVIASELGNRANIIDYSSDKTETFAPKLYKLATAQIAAGKYGYTAQDTLDIIQRLYEQGYLSYPRTDCEYISSTEDLYALLKSAISVPKLEPYIRSIDSTVLNKVRATKKWVNDKALESSGHSALIPTNKKPDFNNLSADEQKIYSMVCERFVSIFLPPLVQMKTKLIADIDGKTFKSTGKHLIDPGFTKLTGTNFSDYDIPEHNIGDILGVDHYDVTDKTTQCPKRFTDATIIAACETPHKYLEDSSLKSLGKNLSIGTPATRASIVEKLIAKHKYLTRMQDKKTTYIVPTDIGMSIYQNLKDCNICKVDMTGEWEIMLNQIRTGEATLNDIEQKMMRDVEQMIEDIKSKEMTPLNTNRNAAIAICPKCGGEIRTSAKSFFCSNWQEGCKIGAFNKVCDTLLKPDEFATLISGKSIKKKIHKGTSSWTQELTYNFDEYKIEFVKNEDSGVNTKQESEYDCPRCGKKLTENSKLFICDDCEFKFWKSAGGKFLTDKQIKEFFEYGDTGLVCGIKSAKTGRLFNAHIKLKSDCSGTEYEYER